VNPPINMGNSQVDRQDVTNDPAIVAGSSSPCSKCGERPRHRNYTYCLECKREVQRNWHRANSKKSPRQRCAVCGQVLPHRGKRKGCPEQARRYLVQRGRQKINERWPGYGDILGDEQFLERAGRSWPRVVHYPVPSRVFHGLWSGLDQRLIRDARDKDVVLCQAVAAIPAVDQREFLELYLRDVADAQRWAALPRWKRPIRQGDADDIEIWKFFTMQRLNMEQAASDGQPWSMASQGAQLPQMFGAIGRLSPQGVQKLTLVMSAYGTMLQHGCEMGDVVTKPWIDLAKLAKSKDA
jgi:hypothetical protein